MEHKEMSFSTVREFARKLDMKVITGACLTDREITGVYACDLLSWVMSHAEKGNVWVTVLTNLNIVAVAVLTEVSCIVVPENIEVEAATVKRAEQEGVIILGTGMTAFEVCCCAGRPGTAL